MALKDNSNQEVIHLSRPLRCSICWFPCCLQTLEVSSPPGTVIGYVNQLWTCWRPKFEITDATGNVVLVIEGPWYRYSICGSDVEFKILTPDETQVVGKISKQWSGLVKKAFTDADNFGIS